MIRNQRRNRKYVEQLRAIAPFAECSTRELRLVASFMTPITRPAGTVLVQQGTRGRECFVIVAGQAVVERDGAIVGHAVAGSIVGELALMGEPRRTATVTAATDVEILVMSQTEFASIRGLGIR
ncbi:MAG: cyclic nucleotide-binding domain-containing protein, partial [Acidimicrobiia bacterium]